MYLRGQNMMIFSETQMCEIVREYLNTKCFIDNNVLSVDWSEREDGFVVDLEPKEGPIVRAKKQKAGE